MPYKIDKVTGEMSEYIFDFGGIVALRNFTARTSGERLIIQSATNANFTILDALVSEVEIDGVVYDTPAAAQEALQRLVFNPVVPVIMTLAERQLLQGALQKDGYTGTAQDLKTLIDGKSDISHTHSWEDITDKPTLFSGSYNDLTNKPTPAKGQRKTHTIDLRGWDNDTYYPLLFTLNQTYNNFPRNEVLDFEIHNHFNSENPVDWSVHPAKHFHSLVKWTSYGSYWGQAKVEQKVSNSLFRWTSQPPVIYLGQVLPHTIEFVHLRGGGMYNVMCDERFSLEVLQSERVFAETYQGHIFTLKPISYNRNLVIISDMEATTTRVIKLEHRAKTSDILEEGDFNKKYYPQNGNTMFVNNDIHIEVDSPNGFSATYQLGFGSVTFTAKSGYELIECDGTNVLNGDAGSTATVTVMDNTVYLRVSNI